MVRQIQQKETWQGAENHNSRCRLIPYFAAYDVMRQHEYNFWVVRPGPDKKNILLTKGAKAQHMACNPVGYTPLFPGIVITLLVRG